MERRGTSKRAERSCIVCHDVFLTKTEFDVHFGKGGKNCTANYPVRCDICLKWLPNTRALTDHKRKGKPNLKKIVDLVGQSFGRLTVISISGRDKWGRVTWLCKCDCGVEKIVRSNNLRTGNSTSCDCYRLELSAKNGGKAFSKIVGPLHWHWNPNLTDEERKNGRLHYDLKSWKLEVFKRDNFKCRVCKKSGIELAAHHLNSFAEHKEQALLVENGVTLCKECHEEFHGVMGGCIYPTKVSDLMWFKKLKNFRFKNVT